MSKVYPKFKAATMIYNDQNEYTIIEASDLPLYLEDGWHATPRATIHDSPKEHKHPVKLSKPALPKIPLRQPRKDDSSNANKE